MKIIRNPVIQEGIHVYSADRQLFRTLSLFLGIAGLLVFLGWPKDHFTYFLQFRKHPLTFEVVLVGIYICAALICAKFGFGGRERRKLFEPREWITLSPLSIGRFLWGKALLCLMFSCFLLLIVLPFAIVSCAASGVRFTLLIPAGAIIVVSAFTYAVSGLFYNLAIYSPTFWSALAFWVAVIFVSIITVFALPGISPIIALLSLVSGDSARFTDTHLFGLALPYYSRTILAHTAALAVMLILSGFHLLKVKRRGNRHD